MFFCSPNIQTSSGVHRVSNSVDAQVLSLGYGSWVMVLTAHVLLVQRLRMSGAVHCPSYTFMVWTGTTVQFLFYRWGTLVSIQWHQMSQPSGSTCALYLLYSGDLALSLLFGEQV
jgi:hypothetical protein